MSVLETSRRLAHVKLISRLQAPWLAPKGRKPIRHQSGRAPPREDQLNEETRTDTFLIYYATFEYLAIRLQLVRFPLCTVCADQWPRKQRSRFIFGDITHLSL